MFNKRNASNLIKGISFLLGINLIHYPSSPAPIAVITSILTPVEE